MRRIFILLGGLCLMLVVVGCMGALPEATPIPDKKPTKTAVLPTATVTPIASATPLATETLVPLLPTIDPPLTATPSSGYYRDAELGFWFQYPNEWTAENIGSDLPSVIIRDNNDPIWLLAGGTTIPADQSLIEFARNLSNTLPLGDEIRLLDMQPTTLVNGIPAQNIVWEWLDEDGQTMQGNGVAAIYQKRGYLLLIYAHPEVMQSRKRTVSTLQQSLHLEQPELFGVSRANGIVLLAKEPENLDPAFSLENRDGIIGHLYSGLVRLNDELQIEPDLAESWDVLEGGLAYQITLRPDIFFHSGKPITAHDVKVSLNRARFSGSFMANLYLQDIDSIELIDAYHLNIHLKEADPYFLAKLTHPVASVVSADQVERVGWWRQPDGTGPFKLKKWQEGRVLILERNKLYHFEPVAIDQIVYLLGGENSVAAYESGAIDYTAVSPFNLSRVLDSADPLSADLHTGSKMCTEFVFFNRRQPFFDDLEIRKAFTVALDRELLRSVVAQGSVVAASSLLPPGMPGYQQFDEIEFDSEFAGAAIASYEGEIPPLSLTVMGGGEPSALVNGLVEMWQIHLGVELEIRLVDESEYIDTVRNEPTDLILYDWCADYPNPENLLGLFFASDGAGNFARYENSEIDQLVKETKKEIDPQSYIQLWSQIEQLLLADMAAIPLWHPIQYSLISSDIKGFKIAPLPILWQKQLRIERE